MSKKELVDTIQIVLIILKAFGLIDWSWWKVFIPVYILVGMALIVAVMEEVHDGEKTR